MKKLSLFALASVALVYLTACHATPSSPETPVAESSPTEHLAKEGFAKEKCQVGVYGTSEHFVALTKQHKGFRYMFNHGETGSVGQGAVQSCHHNSIKIEDGRLLMAQDISTTRTHFDVDGVTLAGVLLEPKNADSNTTLIVYAHGSEESGWIEQAQDPYQMVARGLSVFVYDKRGTGLSEGQYSQNFPQLAKDLVAASFEARRLAKGRFGRFGLFGLSQGGWIAPLAAEEAKADFIAIGYGLVSDILEEDAAQVELELTQAGYAQDILEKAKKVTDITALIAVSSYQKGLDELDELKAKYSEEAWFRSIRGGFSGVILNIPTSELRTQGIPMFDRLNIDWSLKPLDVLRTVKVPQLWVLAGEDREAPIKKTIQRLNQLRHEGQQIELYVFPNTDHGMWEFQENQDGSRKYTQVTEGFHALMADWAQYGKLHRSYGSSIEYKLDTP